MDGIMSGSRPNSHCSWCDSSDASDAARYMWHWGQ